eukprot:jgi/Bigna1/78628/fgenesh1_pg.56_\
MDERVAVVVVDACCRFVHSQFRAQLRGNLPEILTMKPDFSLPVTEIKASEIDDRVWHNRLRACTEGGGRGERRGCGIEMQHQGSNLAEHCRAIIDCTCEYQQSRVKRTPLVQGKGYLNDPSSLVLQEIRQWVVEYLSRAHDASSSCLETTVARRRYVEALMNFEQFPPGNLSEITMIQTLAQVRSHLNECVAKIKRRIAGTTTQQRLGALISMAEKMLLSLAQYLCLATRDSAHAPRCTTMKELAKWVDAMESTGEVREASFLLLRDATRADAIRRLYNLPRPTPPSSNRKERQGFQGDVKGYGGKDEKRRCHQQPDRQPPQCELDEDPEILGDFVEMHTSLERMAELLIALKAAKSVSVLGGQLLLVGSAGREMSQVLIAVEQLLNFLEVKGGHGHFYRELLVVCFTLRSAGSRAWSD